jgi:hypothetical protein
MIYYNNNINKEFLTDDDIGYLYKNNNEHIIKLYKSNNDNNKAKISLENLEIRSFITKTIFKNSGIYNIIFTFVNKYYEEIMKNNEYRQNNNLFNFYIKGNVSLLFNLCNNKYYKNIDDPQIPFDKSDLDTNLYIDISSDVGYHLVNISKSLSQKLMYYFRKILCKNFEFIKYLNTDVVDIANNDISSEIKKKYNIKSIKKLQKKDILMYKHKDFKSRWETNYDNQAHNIIISYNETIPDFLLYRLLIPYLVTFYDGNTKVINAELIDLSIIKINPKLSLYNTPKVQNNINFDINTIIDFVKNDKPISYSSFKYTYNSHYLLWDKITTNKDKYIINIKYNSYDNLYFCSLHYLLFEYCLILINDKNDLKNESKIQKIKLILDVFKNYLKIPIEF